MMDRAHFYERASQYAWLCVILLMFGSCNSEETCEGYYGNGKLEYEVSCDSNGDFQGEMTMYHNNGKIKATRYFEQGIEIDTARYYYDDGTTLQKILPFQEGEAHGLEIQFHSNGLKFKETNYKEGQLQGVYKIFSSNGNLELEGEFHEDMRWGPWMRFYEHGSPKSSFSFVYGQPYGAFAVYRENGVPYVGGNLNLGLLDGYVNYYDAEGSIVHRQLWKEGVNLDHKGGNGMDSQTDKGVAEFLVQGTKIRIDGESVEIE